MAEEQRTRVGTTQAPSPAISVTGRPREHGAQNGTPERAGDGQPERRGRQPVSIGEGSSHARDHRGVEAEQEAAQRGDDSAFQQEGVHFHRLWKYT